MKTAVSVLALAAGAAATGFRNFPPFPCPANTDNKCTDFQKPGFSFGDLNLGPFTQYKDFSFKGFTCGNGGGFGGGKPSGGKSIGGVCGPDKSTSPSFGCGPAVDKFSLGSIFVKPEFDCDLEFHYDMPDGKICKHRNSCKKSGTNVVNTQCGGAKNVTIIFPPQPNKPKPSCSIDISTISFDCNPPKTTTVRTTTSPTSTIVSTTSAESTTSVVPTTSATLSPPTLPPFSSVATTSSATEVTPPASSPTTPPVDTDTKTVPTIGDSTTSGVPVNTQSTTKITTTLVTSFQTTSTIFSTVVSTITSCAPTVPDCPGNGNSVTTTVVTVAISTTICPVTETRTTVLTSTTSLPGKPPVSGPPKPPVGPPVSPTPGKPPVSPPNAESSTTLTVDIGTLTTSVRPSTTSGNSPVETLPCPAVVPACLNTFLFSVGCADNSDANCYCPDAIFVKNVFECIYAHGETDSIISEAVIFFQGICAPHLPNNPGIATGADITKYITVTAAPTAIAPIFTTVTVDATTVVPCTDDAGETIPNSSTTVVISTTLAVPQVGFTTASGTVGVIPVTQAPIPVQNPGAPGTPGSPGAPGSGPAITSFVSTPVGTGGIRPTTTGFPIVTAGSGRVTAGLGFSLGMALLAVWGL